MGAGQKKPNVLFIMADQYRFDYAGYAGAGFVRTPNIDRIAKRGGAFTNCYTNSPLCAPARISLATGLQPARLGIYSNSNVLDPQLPTLYQRFRDNGYRVHCVGKLDLNKRTGTTAGMATGRRLTAGASPIRRNVREKPMQALLRRPSVPTHIIWKSAICSKPSITTIGAAAKNRAMTNGIGIPRFRRRPSRTAISAEGRQNGSMKCPMIFPGFPL